MASSLGFSTSLAHNSLAKAVTVVPNPTSRNPSYILSLELSPSLSAQHQALSKKAKPTYTSSAQITTQHPILELTGALMLTLINFPRKQIGRTMSDCLTTGVMPTGAEVSDKEKRENTVFVRPFLGVTPNEQTINALKPGSKVGVAADGGLVESNPRDLTWDEFVTMHFLVGRVINIPEAAPSSGSDAPEKAESDQAVPIPLIADFGTVVGQKDAVAYLRPGFISAKELVGRQILAVVNLEVPPSPSSSTDEGQASDTGTGTDGEAALVLTVGGITTVEPAKEVENGYHLA
jgi:hypothetical protein